jgi:hypothetical protein
MPQIKDLNPSAPSSRARNAPARHVTQSDYRYAQTDCDLLYTRILEPENHRSVVLERCFSPICGCLFVLQLYGNASTILFHEQQQGKQAKNNGARVLGPC